ncbi:protein N-terminal glutamine amidohydrolase isoform X2 [Epinephelus fuscoguttatus]|uniref:protein N-terminal glutamine amidohydrolase isoform X2 n=1 Tax=Epinephelus fuscoguttatus TaxID=293821 RepID=UPI0020D0B57F|nr:protein N-terminal glutamine amidohydrolase isoform X2 [Epinephelus fuscoguttatus]
MEREDGTTPSRENCVYTSCYCEENVWKLCEFIRTERTVPLEELLVVFISNENRTVPLWKQKSGRGDHPVIWDYHVILLQVGHQPSSSLVYDLDSELAFPCSLTLYAAEALRSDSHINPAYHRVSDEPGRLHQYDRRRGLGGGLHAGPLPAEICGGLFIVIISSSFLFIVAADWLTSH